MSSKNTVASPRSKSNVESLRILPERESRRRVDEMWPEMQGLLAAAAAETSRVDGMLEELMERVESLYYDWVQPFLDENGIDPLAVEPPGGGWM